MDPTARPPDRPTWRVTVVVGALALAVVVLVAPAGQTGTLLLFGLAAVVGFACPPAMIALVLLSVPVQDAVVLPIVFGEVTLTQIAVIGLSVGWGIILWRRAVWLDGVWWWFLIVLAALLISIIAMDESGSWAGEVYRWGVAAGFYLICRSALREWASIRLALWAIVGGVAATSAHAYGQVIAGNGRPDLFQGGLLRAYGAFGEPNPLAAYMEFSVPVLAGVALAGFRASVRERIGADLWVATGLASAMGTATIALTQSRGGWIGFAVAGVSLLWVVPLRLRLTAIAVGVLLFAVVLLTPLGQSQMDRYGQSLDASEPLAVAILTSAQTGREWLWGAAIGMLMDHPFTGVGAGEYDYHFRQYTTDWYNRFPIGQAHNGYLHMAAQAGIPGLVAFVGWIGAMLVSLASATRRDPEPVSRALSLGAFAVVLAFTVHSVVDYLNVLSLGLQLSAVVAVGLNLAPERLRPVRRRQPDLALTPTAQQAGNA